MGWAKYFEDNVEIMLERQFMMQSRMKKADITVVCKTNNLSATSVVLSVVESPVITDVKKHEDKYIVCKDCGRVFLFSAKSQNHFQNKGWEPPKRCKCCREFRNARYLMCSSF